MCNLSEILVLIKSGLSDQYRKAHSSSVPDRQLCKEALQELSDITGDSAFLTVISDLPVRSLSMPLRDVYGNGVCALSVPTLTIRVEQNHDKMVGALKRITETLALKIRGSIVFKDV